MADESIFPVRALPANLEAEAALLGAILYRNRAIDQCEGLESDHFADAIHARVFRDCRTLIQSGNAVDTVLLATRYTNSGVLAEVGGNAFLAGLTTAMVQTSDVRHYAAAIRECWLRRQAIELAQQLTDQAFGADPDLSPTAIMEQVSGALASLAAIGQSSRLVTLDEAMSAAEEAMERARKGQTAGISTGYKCFDARLGGLEPGLVYVIAGRPAMGKSSAGHQIALNAARNGKKVLEIALEMSATQLGRRTLSAAANVPIFAMKDGRIGSAEASRLVLARRELSGLPLLIDDSAGRTPSQIIRQCRALTRTKGLDLVMIDHLNLMRADTEDAKHGGTWATERASAAMLELAKECNLPVLLLAQLNRGVEGREDKRPTLSDLRQAGAIEQDAYAVGFVYRPEYYLGGEPEQKDGETRDKLDSRRETWRQRKDELAGKAEMIWQKVRDGEPGTDHLWFDGPTATFREPQ